MRSEIRDHTLFLGGDITVKTVDGAALRQFSQQCGQSGVEILDLSGVARADSACVALILDALRQSGRKIRLQNLPDSVGMLAGLYEINDWIHP